jgi:hypothetical protein
MYIYHLNKIKINNKEVEIMLRLSVELSVMELMQMLKQGILRSKMMDVLIGVLEIVLYFE